MLKCFMQAAQQRVACIKHKRSLLHGQSSPVDCKIAELLFDAEELVVLADAVSSAGGTCLYLAGICGDRNVCDRRVLRLA